MAMDEDMNMNMDIIVLVSITSLLLSSQTILATKQPPSIISPRQQRLLSQVHETCTKTAHPLLCTKSVMHYYKTSSFSTASRIEPVTVLYAAIEATSEYIKRAVLEAGKLQNDKSFGALFGVCKEVYGKVVVDLRTAVDGILTKDLFALFTNLQNVEIAAKACEEALEATSSDEKVVVAMREFDDRASQMGVVCLDLAHILDWPVHD